METWRSESRDGEVPVADFQSPLKATAAVSTVSPASYFCQAARTAPAPQRRLTFPALTRPLSQLPRLVVVALRQRVQHCRAAFLLVYGIYPLFVHSPNSGPLARSLRDLLFFILGENFAFLYISLRAASLVSRAHGNF